MSDVMATVDPGDQVRDQPPATSDADGSRLWLLTAVVGVVLLGSLAYGITVAVRAASSPASPAASPSLTEVQPDWPAGDFRWLLVARPTGATAAESFGSADHTLTVGQAAAIYGGTADAQTYLQNLGFQQGAATAWRADSPRQQVRISLLQFGDASRATTWVADLQRSLGAAPEIETAADLTDIPGGRWFLIAQVPSRESRIAHAVFRQGAIGVLLTFWLDPSVAPGVVAAVARDQYGKLPAA